MIDLTNNSLSVIPPQLMNIRNAEIHLENNPFKCYDCDDIFILGHFFFDVKKLGAF